MKRDSNIRKDHSNREKMTSPNSNYELIMSRRSFLYGALGVGALAASVTMSPPQAHAEESESDLSILSVSTNDVFTLDDCTEVATDDYLTLLGSYELPYGTLLWCNSDTLAACLLPTETSNPLTQIGALYLSSGNCITILDRAIGDEEDFEIYDVRGNENGFIWTEASILSGIWRIYSAPFTGDALGEAQKLDEGDSGWETPTTAVVGNSVFWQVLPTATGPNRTEDSVLKRAEIGSSDIDVVYRSQGRMSSPPYPLQDSLVITPRTSTDSVHHRLTLLDVDSREIRDTLVLPQGMKPLEAGYGNTGFCFSFEGIYDYGEGISNLGTYTPQHTHDTYDYGNKTWFRFNKAPSAPPSWCGDIFFVKSSRPVCGVDLPNKTYFAIDVESGADSYGDYLASTGVNDTVLTYTNINSISIEGEEKTFCLVRVWEVKAL